MIGKYERKDGTRFDVIPLHRNSFQRADESSGLKNRLFSPVTQEELEHEIKNKDIKKIE